MINIIKSKLDNIKTSSNERSKNLIKNVVLSFILKGGGILVSLMLIPMTINYVNATQYGIWITISSLVNWLTFFDVGLGNGLRNKLTDCIARNEVIEGKKYISTTYFIICIISLIILLSSFIINPLINWSSLLNIQSEDVQLSKIILIVIISFCAQFIVQLINTVLVAVQKTALSSLISLLGQVISLLVIFLLINYSNNTLSHLQNLVLTLSLCPIIVMIIFSIYYYYFGFLKDMSPSLSFVDLKYARQITSIGGVFFIIQIGALILYQTNNIIITKMLGSKYVTDFNVSYKLYSVVMMAFTIIITPYWSAFTDAYAKKDYRWMKNNISIMRRIWLLLSIVTIIIFFLADYIFKFWIGDAVTITRRLSLATALYIIVNMWQTLHVYFLNGISKIKLQLILVTISAGINIPLSIFLGKKYGIEGIISANTILFTIMGLFFYLQVSKVLNNKASGIWQK